MKSIATRLGRPAYTRRQRCWPCTLVNLALLSLGCGALAVAGLWIAVPPVAVAGVAAIWLRGYLVPYTPQFAPRLASALPGEVFHATDGGAPVGGSDSLADGEATDGERVVSALLEAGVLVTGEDDQLRLEASAREAWLASMASLGALEPAELAARVRALSGAGEVETTTRSDGVWYLLRADGGAPGDETLLSRPVAIAEIGALDTLDDRVDDPAVRRQAVEPLRMFLDSCPVCEQPLIETDTMDCCGGTVDPRSEPAPVLACPDCERRLYTFPT